jgi:hypothetical protein
MSSEPSLSLFQNHEGLSEKGVTYLENRVAIEGAREQAEHYLHSAWLIVDRELPSAAAGFRFPWSIRKAWLTGKPEQLKMGLTWAADVSIDVWPLKSFTAASQTLVLRVVDCRGSISKVPGNEIRIKLGIHPTDRARQFAKQFGDQLTRLKEELEGIGLVDEVMPPTEAWRLWDLRFPLTLTDVSADAGRIVTVVGEATAIYERFLHGELSGAALD